MALVCCFVLLPTIFGIIEVAYAFYAFNFVSSASREATRYAIVRGSTSCTIAPSFPNCNLSPTSSGNPLQTYVTSLGYPGLNTNSMTVSATWWSAHVTNPAGSFSTTDWDQQCTTVDLNGYSCNLVRNAVQVVVTYQFPLNIPFWKNVTIPISSSAKMVISE